MARKYELEKKHKLKSEENSRMSTKALEEINRTEALSKSSLTDQNKGFNLMLKMGYKSGQALGRAKNDNPPTVNIEPISVEIKLDRGGLGQAEEKKRKLDEIKALKQRLNEAKVHTEVYTTEAYLSSKRFKFKIKKDLHNLHKCQKICYQLDSTRRVSL